MGSGSDEYWKRRKAHEKMLEKSNKELATVWLEAQRSRETIRNVYFWDHELMKETTRTISTVDSILCPAVMSGMKADEARDIFLEFLGQAIREFNT